jgi:hypothetical protein
MRRPLAFACALFTSTSSIPAGEAVFSPDGKSVHVCLAGSNKVTTVSLADGKASAVDFGKDLGEEETPVALTYGPKGIVWLATQHAVWHWQPAEKKVEKKAAVPGDTIEDIAWNPKSDTLYITGRQAESKGDQLVALKPGEKEIVGVKMGLTTILVPAFDREGRLFFRSENDLWVGSEREPNSDEVEMAAYRVAPLAELVSEHDDLSGSKIISGIAPVDKSVFMTLRNRVQTDLVKLPKPKGSPDDVLEGHPHSLKATWKRMIATLQSAEVSSFPEHVTSIEGLCASPDGARMFFIVFYENGEKTYRLMDMKTGKTKVIGKVADE